ncbi:hypothetical protein BKH46_00385 [Helicobacter sp. 12S02634-8]|uniref:PD-(D/E)XK nuclease family protein n=1 Tax=Helicobacter sp. 12S02634-8 TaxID=1476199 RepID=UPI000BA71143|nr:PD-(D/E)XK nuclease family protein [Helicobacter sp. 12S02634-8]PAF48406.1 hypothetical protein BKH46_00385 [Helicobacter sp. 12S02634-8]
MVGFFTQKTPLYVFATRRRINGFYRECGEGFLPVALSASEFFRNVVSVSGKQIIPKNIRKVFLLEIIAKMAEARDDFEYRLVFEKSFLGYLESSSFLFEFFDELTAFDINLKEIPLKDTYGDYEEYLNILLTIYKQYTQKLQEYGFFDILGRGGEYEILEGFFDGFSCVEFYLDGFLNAQEKKILDKVSESLDVFLHIECDRYNQGHFGFLKAPLQEGFCYKINLKTSEILEQIPIKKDLNIEVFSFASRLSQASLVFERIDQWLTSPTPPERFAIITPSEDFSEYLKLLDRYGNLNFAMGEGIENCAYFALLQERLKALKQAPIHKEENPLQWLTHYTQELLETSGEKDLFWDFHSKILLDYERIAPSFSEFLPAEILELYILDLRAFRIDNVSGGKIKVMGVLESRGLCFEEVVVVDFNDKFVPNLNDSDMFLNTRIRKALQIPTLKDKQDLQKHYYLQLFENTQKISIAYVNSEDTSYCKMLDELGIAEGIKNGDGCYRIFPFNQEKPYQKDQFLGTIPKDFEFSASKLSDFLSCKRKFYLKFIQKLKEPKSPDANIGTLLHTLLCDGYKKYINQTPDVESIKQEILQKSEQNQTLKATERLNLQLALKDLERFWRIEKNRADEGMKVLGCEVSFITQIGGFTFKGKIDRIDAHNGHIALLDYKYKSSFKVDTEAQLADSCDFQMPVYFYGAKALGYSQDVRAYFYDLKNEKHQLREEETLEQKTELLQEKLKIFNSEIDFVMTEDKKTCGYCPFKDICGVEI